MSCSVKSSTTFHTRTACMSGSMSPPHVGHTSHVKHRDYQCLILLILFLRLLIDGVNLNLIKKVIKCISCTKLCLPFKFSKEKKSIFSNIYRIFCRCINMTEVKSTIQSEPLYGMSSPQGECTLTLKVSESIENVLEILRYRYTKKRPLHWSI